MTKLILIVLMSTLSYQTMGNESPMDVFDSYYDDVTGAPIDDTPGELPSNIMSNSCYRQSCAVWIFVSKETQILEIYENGLQIAAWPVSTGRRFRTKNWDNHPTGPVHDKWDSTKYPEGDYKGMGNMPYAVFYYKGYAIHGTPEGNWKRLGKPASHGCIRLHPDNAFIMNRLVRKYGLANTWVTVY